MTGREGEGPEEIRVARDAVRPRGAADGFDVLDNDADDFAEAERDDGEIIAPQPQRRHADDQAGEGRRESADEQCAGEQDGFAPPGGSAHARPGPMVRAWW